MTGRTMSKARRKLKRAAGRPTKRAKPRTGNAPLQSTGDAPSQSAANLPLPRTGNAPFITRAEALRRAEQHVLERMFKGATVKDGKTARWSVYDATGRLAREEVWLVCPNPERPGNELRSSQIIAVCKRTGRVLFEGSAHDEG